MIKQAIYVALFSIFVYLFVKLSGPSYSKSVSSVPPWPLFKIGTSIADFIHSLSIVTTPEPFHTFSTARSYTLSSSLYVIAKMKVADVIGDNESMDINILANKLNVKAEKLFKIIRYLSSEGYFSVNGDNISLTSTGKLFRTDGEYSNTSISWCIIHMNEEVREIHDFMLDEVKTGKEAHTSKFGKDIFAVYQEKPESAEAFTKCMNVLFGATNPALFAEYDFSQHHTLVDVGGGIGPASKTILSIYKDTINSKLKKAIVMDLAEIVAHVEKYNDETLSFVGGNFFDASTIPSGDVMLINGVLHDWNDEECITILKNSASKLLSGGRIIVSDTAVPDRSSPLFNTVAGLDVYMTTITSGSFRTYPEYNKLWAAAGLNLVEVRETRSIGALWILERL